MILQNKDFHKDEPFVVSNAREILELDPQLERFPWDNIEKRQEAAPLTAWERLFIHGIYGNWWQLGHKNVSQMHPKDMYMENMLLGFELDCSMRLLGLQSSMYST